MVNTKLFKSCDTTVRNEAGGKAYENTAKHALAQIACTGYFQDTFYASDEQILQTLKNKVEEVIKEPDGFTFIAKLAVYSRNKAHMKDMPSFLCAILAKHKQTDLLKKVFAKCVNNAKQLRSFIQISRSMEINVSRRSIKNLVRQWFNSVSDIEMLNATVGNSPSLTDIIKMCHVKVDGKPKKALLNYILGTKYNSEDLPGFVHAFENFKKGVCSDVPEGLDFRLLDCVSDYNQLKQMWTKQASRKNWHFIRMNLNNFFKYGVLQDKKALNNICNTLRDCSSVKYMPYQVFTAYNNINENMPVEIREALHDAMEKSVNNVPAFSGDLAICVDISSSMLSTVSHKSKATFVEIAALFTASILRVNPRAKVVPFNNSVNTNLRLEPRDTVLTNANKIAQIASGGTRCESALEYLNTYGVPDNIVFISDNQSWVSHSPDYTPYTGYQREWNKILKKNPKCRMVCLDIAPYITSQCKDNSNVLKVGGFSDSVFEVAKEFLENSVEKDKWMAIIDHVSI